MYILLNTLTPVDYVNIVTFATYATIIGPSQGLIQATPANIAILIQAVSNIVIGGNTYFSTAFATAFPIFTADPSATSGCRRLMFFLTDGVTQNSQANVYSTVSLYQTALLFNQAIFFTYSLSSASDDVIPQYLACTYNGIWAKIQDGASASKIMSQYYLFLAAGITSRTARWTAPYTDPFGLGSVITVSREIYDNTSGVNIFAGIVGITVRMSDLLATSTLSQINAATIAQSTSCPAFSLTLCQMAKLRTNSNSSFTCPNLVVNILTGVATIVSLGSCALATDQVAVPLCGAPVVPAVNSTLCSAMDFTQVNAPSIGQCCRSVGCAGYNPSQVNWTIPSSVYVGSSVQGSITIPYTPNSFEPLSFSLTASPAGALTSTNLPVFQSNSSATMSFTLNGVTVGTQQLVNLTVVQNTDNYVAASPINITVKPLESVGVSGIPSQIYVGQTVTATLTLTALPPVGTITVTPSGTGVTFTGAPVTFSTTLTQNITVTFTQVGIASVSFAVSGTGSSYFSTIAPLSTNVYALQTITSTFAAFSNNAFVYIGQGVTLTVSLGNPPITRTSNVVVALAYADGTRATFPSTITFTPGTNTQTVTMTGAVAQVTAASVVVTISQGSNSFVVSSAVPTLSVLSLIPIALQFNTATQLIVVGRTLTLTVAISTAMTSLAGPVTVTLAYGSQVTISSPVTFAANSSTTTATVQITGVTAVAAQPLTVALSGTGAATYVVTQASFTVPVLTPRFVFVPSATLYLPIGGSGTVTFQLDSLPTYASDQIVVTLQSNAFFTWSASTVSLFTGSPTAQVTVVALAAGTPSIVNCASITSFTNEYVTTLKNATAVQIIAPTSITVTVPSFVYIGNTVQGTVTLAQLPPPTAPLSLAFASNSNLGFTALASFSSASSSLSQTCTITGLGQGTGAIVQLGISPSNAYYNAAATQTISVRPLETAIVSGVPQAQYIGQTSTVTITISRAPAYAGTSLTITPQSTAGTFSPATVTFTDASTTLTATVTFTATTVSAGAAVTFSTSGTAAPIFTTIASTSVIVYAKENVSLSIAPSAVDSTSGFVYVQNSVALTISLGTPVIFHQQAVSVQLSYAVSSALNFSSSTVTIPAGVNSTAVTIGGLVANSVASLSATVTQGADVFVAGSPVSLRVLALIPIALQIDTATQLVVVGRTLSLTVGITGSSTSLVGPVTVTLAYGSQVTLSSAVTFAQNSATTTATVQITGVTAVAAQALTVSLSGAGASTYVLAQSTFNFPVLIQRFVLMSFATSALVFGTQGSATFSLASLPTLANDAIVLTLTNGNGIVWSATSVTLYGSSPSASVTFTASSIGTISLATLVTVTSTSTEYATLVTSALSTIVRVLSSISWSVPSFVYVGFINSSSITLSALPPLIAPLQLSLSASGVQFSPLTTFTSILSVSQGFNIIGTSPATAVTVSLSIVAGGTFYTTPSTQSIDIRPLEIVSISGLPASLYMGQSVSVNITVTRLPPYAGSTLSVAATSTVGTFSPASVSFAYGGASLVATVTFTASSSGNATFALGISGSAGPIFTSALPAVTTVVLPSQAVVLSTTCPSTPSGSMTCTDNSGAFIYVGSVLTLLVDIGSPQWTRTSDVSIQLNYGGSSAVTFSQNPVVLPPNVNSVTVSVTGVSPQAVQLITTTILQGAPSYASGTPLPLRVLAKIPASLQFYPGPQLIVVNGVLAVPFTINASTTSLAGALTVSPQGTSEVSVAPALLQFSANSQVTSGSVQITGQTISALSTLTLAIDGPAASTYTITPSQFTFPVLAQRLVNIDTTSTAQYVLVGSTSQVTFLLQSLPTLSTDVITLSLQNSATITWATLTAQLSAQNNSVTVSLSGTAAGIQSIAALVTVASTSTEYSNTLSNDLQITVRTVGTISWTIPSFLYVGLVNTNTFTLSQAPPSSFPLTASLTGSNLQFSQLVPFTSAGSNSQSFNVTGVIPSGTATAVSVVASVTLSSGSQFYAAPATQTVTIRPLETVSLAGLPAQLYSGQSVNATVQFSTAPQYAGTQIVVTLSSLAGTFSPSTVTCNYGDQTTSQTVVFTAGAAVSSQSFSLALTGTASSIFTVAQPPAVTIFSQEVVSLSVDPSAVDATSGFVYVQNSIALTVSLGTPAIAHQQTVSVQLSYADGSKVSFSANPVVFAAGVNTTTVSVTGLIANAASSITASRATMAIKQHLRQLSSRLEQPFHRSPSLWLLTGTASSIFTVAQPPAVTIFSQEVVSLSVDPSAVDATSGFVYVQNSIALTVSLGTPAIAHQQTVSVQLSYADGSKVSFSANPVVFAAGVNTTTVSVTGLIANAASSVTATVTGVAASSASSITASVVQGA
ncbi:Hypothetical protein, putative, partial [Bodo saltans]